MSKEVIFRFRKKVSLEFFFALLKNRALTDVCSDGSVTESTHTHTHTHTHSTQ